MRKYRKLLISLEIIIFTSLTLVISFAWIPRKWSPEVKYEDISISTSPALIINMLDKSGNPQDYKSVIVNDVQNITDLKQLSSHDGKTFMQPDFTPIVTPNGVPVYKNYDNNNAKVKRLIETHFKIKTNVVSNKQKVVFLNSESYLNLNGTSAVAEDASLAIRVAIECGNDISIFCKDKETRVTETFNGTNSAVANGQNIYADYINDDKTLNTNALATQSCIDFKDSSQTKPLFKFNSTGEQDVTVRIWLEGCDQNCVDTILGQSINLMLKFDMAEL